MSEQPLPTGPGQPQSSERRLPSVEASTPNAAEQPYGAAGALDCGAGAPPYPLELPSDPPGALSGRMPDLGALQLLLSVARLSSLGAAAAEHGISQPAASSRIRYMERLIGFPLLVRGARGSVLTAEGSTVARWAVDLLAHAGALDAALAGLRVAHEMRLHVVASTTIAQFLLPSWLADAHTRTRTAVTVEVMNSGQVMDTFLSGAANLGFVEAPDLRHGLAQRVVGADRLVLVVGRSHPWAGRPDPVGDGKLARTPLLHRESGSGTRETLESALAHVAPLASPAWQTDSVPALLEAAVTGRAPAVLSRQAVAADVQRGRLIAVPTTGLHLGRRLRVVWPFGQPLARAQRDFLSCVREPSR